jgi:hypothetical protein
LIDRDQRSIYPSSCIVSWLPLISGCITPIPIDPDYIWNYSFRELTDLGVEIVEDWYSISNIEYDTLNDLRDDFPQFFEDDVVPVDGWEEIAHEPTKHDIDDSIDER